jgi:class 3 adenylate cyclase|tara:strand:+ start:57 stop:443 length:387 start_codon:yes stop_codon:yes gene_type:complete
MVMFGAPLDMSPEEQAEKAAACGLGMQRAMDRLADSLERQNAGHLKMRIGIHQGDAVVGNFGSSQRSDYTCIGPTVNFAARIESACAPGEVFISNELSVLLPENKAIDAGSFEFKGIDGKRQLFKLVS